MKYECSSSCWLPKHSFIQTIHQWIKNFPLYPLHSQHCATTVETTEECRLSPWEASNPNIPNWGDMLSKWIQIPKCLMQFWSPSVPATGLQRCGKSFHHNPCLLPRVLHITHITSIQQAIHCTLSFLYFVMFAIKI